MTRAAVLLLALSACRPDLSERPSIVTAPRVLAVRADPAEGAPRANVTLTALWADASNAPPPLTWAFCNARKPLSELGPVAPTCIAPGGDDLVPLGGGASVASALPDKACKNFGPDVPDATKDAPAGRPVDPDSTGGYYQPVTLAAGDAFSIANVRLTCATPGASPEQLAELAAKSHPNENPTLDDVLVNGAPLAGVTAGSTVHLRASWPASAAEPFAVYDTSLHAVAPRREAMRVAWYATGGAFAVESNGRDETDDATFVENDWTAPGAGEARVWVVLRDSRGGVAWRAYTVAVR